MLSSEGEQVRRRRRQGRHSQAPPPCWRARPVPCRPRRTPPDRDEDRPGPMPERTGPGASSTRGSGPWYALRSRRRKGQLPRRRPSLPRRRQTRAGRHRQDHHLVTRHRSPALRRQDSHDFSPPRPQARRCGHANPKSPCRGQQSSFTGPYEVVLGIDMIQLNAYVHYLFRFDP